MKGSRITLLLVAAAAGLAAGCERAASPMAPVSPAASAVKVKLPAFVFTKLPAAIVSNQVVPGADMDVYDFDLATEVTKGAALTQVEFMVSGSLQPGYLTNYRLVYYPGGRAKPGVVVATNDGSTWVAPGGFSFITLRLTTPLDLGNRFRGSFAFLADVVAPGPFFFWTRLQTASASFGGVESFLLPETCDLPVQGDNFFVN